MYEHKLTSTSEKLKRCPYCREEAELYEVMVSEYCSCWSVWCKNFGDCGAQVSMLMSKQQAIDAWNTRAPISFVQFIVDHYREIKINLLDVYYSMYRVWKYKICNSFK
jgi:hypothetical protein